MLTVYALCAVFGGVILVCQFVLTIAGIGGHHDLGFGAHDAGAGIHTGDSDQTDAQAAWFFGVLTFRSVVAAIAFFGLGGLAANSADLPGSLAFSFGLAAGAAALFIVAWIMRLLANLQAEGTVHIEQAVGAQGSVYLHIPAQRSGAGKVQVNVRDRTMEYLAMTAADALPSGAQIVVVDVLGPNTVEVAPAPTQGSTDNAAS